MALALIGMNDPNAARLPAPPARSTVRASVHQLLKNGLADPASRDLQALPLVACIYAFLGQAGSQRTGQQAAQMFGGNLTPQAFLQNLDRSMVSAIIQLAALMDEAHKEAFMTLEQRLYAVHVTN
jgi:hypothetical protein